MFWRAQVSRLKALDVGIVMYFWGTRRGKRRRKGFAVVVVCGGESMKSLVGISISLSILWPRHRSLTTEYLVEIYEDDGPCL